MIARQIIAKIKECGWLVLTNDNRIHVDLPAGREDLLTELRANKEQVRAILLKRQNAKRKRKAPAFGPEPPQPIYIPVACRCSKYPHPHVHITLEAKPYTVKAPGEVVFEYLREQVREYGANGDALPTTQAAPEKKVELSPWGRPKIKGYTKYRWEGTQ